MNIPVNFIFSVFWKPNSQTASEKGNAYMDIVYTVTYSHAIKANLTANAKVIDRNATTLRLDASNSKFLNA